MNRKFRLALNRNPAVAVDLGVTNELENQDDTYHFGFKNTHDKWYLPQAHLVATPTLQVEDARDFKMLIASLQMRSARVILDAISGKERCGDILISEVPSSGFQVEKKDGSYYLVDG